MAWGIFDTQDRLWLGDETGPKLFHDHEEQIAQLAAQIADVRLGWEPGRCRAMKFEDRTVTERDEVEPRMSTEEALRRIENGAV